MGFSTEKSGTDEKADFSEPAEIAVSYTHLDVYKRQLWSKLNYAV